MSNEAQSYVDLMSNEITAIKRTNEERHPPTRRVYNRIVKGAPRINEDTLATVPAAWACMRYLSGTIALLEWSLRREVSDGFEVARTSRLHRMINKRVSVDYSSFQFREVLMFWALRYGNGYAEIERDTLGRAIALHPIHPQRVQVMRDVDTDDLFYEVTNPHKSRIELDSADMFHLRGFGEGVVGLNVAEYAKESLGWAKAVQLFGAGFFNNGAQPSGVIKARRQLNEDGLRGVREEFINLNGGPKNNGGVAIIDNGMEYESISIAPDKGQFIETNQHLIVETCRWFGVPPHKVGHLLQATFSNIEHQSIEVVQDSIAPWAKRFEDEFDYKVVRSPTGVLTSKFDMTTLLSGDTKARTAYYKTLREMGAMNANQIRRAEGMNTIGDDGDKYLVNSTYTTLEKVGEEPEPIEPVETVDDNEEDDVTENQEIVEARKRVCKWVASNRSESRSAVTATA